MITRTGRIVMAAACLVTAAAGAQDLGHRIENVKNGTVRFRFAAKPGVCGDGRNNISVRPEQSSKWKDVEWACDSGPVMVALSKEDGEVVSIRTYVGARWRTADRDVVDLGAVGVREATDWLLGVGATAASKAAAEAIFPATLADSVTVWPKLLRIARDDARSTKVRSQAVFWLGQATGDEATKGLADVAEDASGDREVRKSAVFALSQQKGNGVEYLLNIAQSNKDKEIRKQAIFWLGQSKDARALDYFEKVLTRR